MNLKKGDESLAKERKEYGMRNEEEGVEIKGKYVAWYELHVTCGRLRPV